MILCESALVKQVYVDTDIISYFGSSCQPSTIVYSYWFRWHSDYSVVLVYCELGSGIAVHAEISVQRPNDHWLERQKTVTIVIALVSSSCL
jgi:hypothetical protein